MFNDVTPIPFLCFMLQAWVAAELPHPYGEEIVGLHEATGIPLGEIVLYNIFYEVFTVCTSIIAEDKEGELFYTIYVFLKIY